MRNRRFLQQKLSGPVRLLLFAGGVLLLWIDLWLLPIAVALIAAAWFLQRAFDDDSGDKAPAGPAGPGNTP
jgi:hypothetical protein